MRTTGKFDNNGQEIFEGDKVIMCWGWFKKKDKNEPIKIYQVHTITVRKAHIMANGETHDDGGGITFNLGNSSNFWQGEQVIKLTLEDVEKIGVAEDQRFFFDEDGKSIKFTDRHFMGLSDED